MISIILPTIPRREGCYRKCIESYNDNTESDIEIIKVWNKPSVGIAWNEGAAKAKGEYLHLTADDLTAQKGWDSAAIEAAESHIYPAPIVYNDYDGEIDLNTINTGGLKKYDSCTMSTIPFMKTSLWKTIGPSLKTHYYTDNWLSQMAIHKAQMSIQRFPDYSFRHHWAKEGRSDMRMHPDNHHYMLRLAKFHNSRRHST